jgi:hypothetical protein
MENSSSPSNIVSNTIVEAPNPGACVEVYLDLLFRTDMFLADKPEYFYDTKVWFGEPSLIQLIIYHDRENSPENVN